MANPIPNHIAEYFAKEGSTSAFHARELFQATKADVDIKTDLNWQEIVLINKLYWNNEYLKRKKLRPIYENFINQYMRLKISLDRKSRKEFVDVNKGDNSQEVLDTASKFSNILGVKK